MHDGMCKLCSHGTWYEAGWTRLAGQRQEKIHVSRGTGGGVTVVRRHNDSHTVQTGLWCTDRTEGHSSNTLTRPYRVSVCAPAASGGAHVHVHTAQSSHMYVYLII